MMLQGTRRRHPRTAGRRLAAFAVFAIALGAGTTTARDFRPDSWTFEVVEVAASDPVGHIITLRPSPPGRYFPRSCKSFVVYAIFDTSGWSPAGQASVPLNSHEQAIEAMQKAQITNDLVRVGVIDRGFAAIDGKDKCEVASRALQYVLRDGQHAIISFYDEP